MEKSNPNRNSTRLFLRKSSSFYLSLFVLLVSLNANVIDQNLNSKIVKRLWDDANSKEYCVELKDLLKDTITFSNNYYIFFVDMTSNCPENIFNNITTAYDSFNQKYDYKKNILKIIYDNLSRIASKYDKYSIIFFNSSIQYGKLNRFEVINQNYQSTTPWSKIIKEQNTEAWSSLWRSVMNYKNPYMPRDNTKISTDFSHIFQHLTNIYASIPNNSNLSISLISDFLHEEEHSSFYNVHQSIKSFIEETGVKHISLIQIPNDEDLKNDKDLFAINETIKIIYNFFQNDIFKTLTTSELLNPSIQNRSIDKKDILNLKASSVIAPYYTNNRLFGEIDFYYNPLNKNWESTIINNSSSVLEYYCFDLLAEPFNSYRNPFFFEINPTFESGKNQCNILTANTSTFVALKENDRIKLFTRESGINSDTDPMKLSLYSYNENSGSSVNIHSNLNFKLRFPQLSAILILISFFCTLLFFTMSLIKLPEKIKMWGLILTACAPICIILLVTIYTLPSIITYSTIAISINFIVGIFYKKTVLANEQ